MTRASYVGFFFGLVLAAGPCHGTEYVEIVLDTSMEMWDLFPDGTPRVVAVRTVLEAFVVSPAATGRNLEFGLRTIGGRSDITIDSGCADSDSLIATGPVDSERWSAALAKLVPRGGRALVHAIEKAAEGLSSADGERRIVVLTSGGDQCHRDLIALLGRLAEVENPITIRIIGLGMNQDLANLLVLSTPMRNVNDPTKLLETLRWAAAPQTAESRRAEWLDLTITYGNTPVDGATLFVVDRFVGEEFSTRIVEGRARIRLAPGRYRARIEGPGIAKVLLDDIVHLGDLETLELVLDVSPPVTLEVDPERPLAGDEAHIHYWGAPPGTNYVAVATAGAHAGQYLLRYPTTGSTTGEVALPLPDFPNRLEVQFTREIGSGMHQLLGRLEFETNRRQLSLEAPERAEIQTPMTLNWSGDELPGDYIIVEHSGEDDLPEDVLCIPAFGGGPITVNAPGPAGNYAVRYKSSRGQSVARASLEVFEILATLEGPVKAAPGEEIDVDWTGPDAAQDFLSLAALGEADDEYRSFSPTAIGSPAVLTAPDTVGDYEIRYVRASDGEVLARHPLAVAAVEIALEVPRVVEAGTRFEVAWSGTAGVGDFIAVAHHRSGPKNYLDWSYTDLGSPVTLAAPFEPGMYVVRYVSGKNNEIVARRSIEVR
jgi:Ca-activated chloride channel family protein